MDWKPHDYVGGHPALDYLNTVSDQDKSRHLNRLILPDDLVAWWEGLSKRPVRTLPSIGAHEVAEIVALREVAFSVFGAIGEGRQPSKTEVAALEAQLVHVPNVAGLEWSDGSLRYGCRPKTAKDALLWLLDDLVRNEDLTRLHQCCGCSWLYLDRGRGKPRKWCNMATCGNRAKVIRFRQKQP